MTKTIQLLALAEAATPGPWKIAKPRKSYSSGKMLYSVDGPACVSDYEDWGFTKAPAKYIAAANPETIKQMCLREQKLVESTAMLKDALFVIARGCNSRDPASIIARDALEAFNNFERNL